MVKEVIETSEKLTGLQANVVMAERRAGDPARLVASSEKIHSELGWKVKRKLEQILAEAWRWHQNQKY